MTLIRQWGVHVDICLYCSFMVEIDHYTTCLKYVEYVLRKIFNTSKSGQTIIDLTSDPPMVLTFHNGIYTINLAARH